MRLKIKGQYVHLPDILILGAAKSGTTSLAFYLKQHPDVFMPRKEPGFFAYHDRKKTDIPSGIRDRQMVNFEEYTRMYEPVGSGQLICDSSVAQFTNHEHTLRNINALYGERKKELKTFLILRNPADRAYSHYQMFVKNALEEMDFKEAWNPEVVEKRRKEQLGFDYLGGSMYAKRVKDILRELPQTKIYITEDLKKKGFLDEFLAACGLRRDVEINTTARLNPSGLPKRKLLLKVLRTKSPINQLLKDNLSDKALFRLKAIKSSLIGKSVKRSSLDLETREYLMQKHFKKDTQDLEKLLDRDLSHWYSQK
jgi:hypothetical protein